MIIWYYLAWKQIFFSLLLFVIYILHDFDSDHASDNVHYC